LLPPCLPGLENFPPSFFLFFCSVESCFSLTFDLGIFFFDPLCPSESRAPAFLPCLCLSSTFQLSVFPFFEGQLFFHLPRHSFQLLRREPIKSGPLIIFPSLSVFFGVFSVFGVYPVFRLPSHTASLFFCTFWFSLDCQRKKIPSFSLPPDNIGIILGPFLFFF